MNYQNNQIIGVSPQIQQLNKLIGMVSKVYKTPVLIRGEIGTGKELVAKAIHYQSKRKNKPLIKMNCLAITDLLLESELFGNEKGAFKDGKCPKKGFFELADGGTVFLYGIEEMNTISQSEICRFLENQTFVRVGGKIKIKVDIRIIASTNKDLEGLVREGLFRKDLYDRLKVLVIEMPPLRNRREDILLLSNRFIEENNRDYVKNVRGISEEAKQLLIRYHWPGNVIELKNVIERAIILAEQEYITPEELPFELRQPQRGGQENTFNKSFEITNDMPLTKAPNPF